MNEHLEPRAPWIPWAITSVALVVVAAIAYAVGASTGGGTADLVRRGWPDNDIGKIWAFFLMFWIFGALRWLWWGPSWRHHARRYHAYYDRWPPHPRDEWEAWHRQAHREMDTTGGHVPGSRPTDR